MGESETETLMSDELLENRQGALQEERLLSGDFSVFFLCHRGGGAGALQRGSVLHRPLAEDLHMSAR
ncbi:hypothetical protein EYF80_004582 [Liparis tanakae]|uniref:Uncharacterized protein n=1 Tax=Liparis tanakae TaxID=230148 RepID=A0A4Z2J709_9TELE|nr:hypothetical protein EYF80_004582 [Liparis tanakae]